MLIPQQKDGILGVSSRFSDTASNIPSREAEEDSTVDTMPPLPTEGLSERCDKVCGQSLSIHKSNMPSPIALQSTAVSDQLSDAREPWSNRACNYEIQCQFESNQGGREQPNLVDIPGPESANTIPNIVLNTKYDNRVRCLQQGLGSPTRRTEHWGKVVAGRILTPHKLPRVIGSLPGTVELCQAQLQYDNSDENGQCHSSDIHQQARRDTLSPVVSNDLDNMGVEPAEEYIPNSRTSPREGECCSRSGIKSDERSLRLDAKSPSIQSNTTGNGPSTNRPVCFLPDKATTNILQLETRPEGTGNRCVQSRLVSEEGIRQPSMVPDCTLSEPSKKAGRKSGDDHSPVGIPDLVSNWKCWKIFPGFFQVGKIW